MASKNNPSKTDPKTDSSSFVTVTTRMSIYFSTVSFNCSNSFLMELIFKLPIINLIAFSIRISYILEHVYMRPEVNSNRFKISNRFEMSFRLHGNLHGDLTAATFQTIARLYCTCANDIF